MNPFAFLDGWKTYIAAAGLFGLALYQFSQAQYDIAFQSLMAALAAIGVKHSMVRSENDFKAFKARFVHHKKDEEVKEEEKK